MMITNTQYNIVHWLDRARAYSGKYAGFFRVEVAERSFIFATDGYVMHIIFESNIEAALAPDGLSYKVSRWMGLFPGYTLEKKATFDPLDVLQSIQNCSDDVLWCNFFGVAVSMSYLKSALDSFVEPIGLYTNSEDSELIQMPIVVPIVVGVIGVRCALIMPGTVKPENCKFQYHKEN